MVRYTIPAMTLLLAAVIPTTGQSGPGVAEMATASEDASAVNLLGQPARLHLERVPLADALARLQERSGIPIAYSTTLLPDRLMVSCACDRVSVREALEWMLDGTGFHYSVFRGQVLIEPVMAVGSRVASARLSGRDGATPRMPWPGQRGTDAAWSERLFPRSVTGSVAGTVTSRTTGQRLGGVSVTIEGTQLGAVTDGQGRYRIDGVPAGAHEVSAQMIGYRTISRQVTVADGVVATVDFAIEYQAISLDEIVVTGSITESRIREMSVPVTVITASEIERLQITGVDQLLRGLVPGVVSMEQGNIGWNTNVTVRGMNSFGVQSIKTYIDGVEIANPENVGMIDPSSIERIEIIRGPQAAAIYGADALGGVLQIFTKKGHATGLDRPRVTVRSTGGFVSGDHAPDSRAATQRHSLELTGGGTDFSYNLGATHNREGEWVEGTHDRFSSVSAGVRATEGRFTAAASLRYVVRDFSFQTFAPFLADRYPNIPTFTLPPRPLDFDQQTMALNVTYAATPRWTHSLVLGFDRAEFGLTNGFQDPAATTGTVENRNQVRNSIRYNTGYEQPLTEYVRATLTAGIDHSRYKTDMFSTNNAPSPQLPGRIPVGDAAVTLDSWTNSGYFGQVRLGFGDDLYLTGALRGEDNRNFGEDHGLAWAPRIGATFIRDFDRVEAKLRAAWGTAIRPPSTVHRTGTTAGSVAPTQPNPAILPEEQTGWEAGVDLLFTDRASLGVTYFDQDVNNLIELTRDFNVDPPFFQYQNLGGVNNRGWELEGRVDFHPVLLRATYSTTTSRVVSLGDGYGGDLRVGDRNLDVPENVLGASITYNFLRGSVSSEVSRVGSWMGLDLIDYYDFVFGGEQYRGSIQEYWSEFDPITRLNLQVEQTLTRNIGASVRVNNVTDEQRGEILSTISVARGRSVLVGLRATF